MLTSIATASHVFATLAFLLFSVMLLTSWRKRLRLHKTVLLLACLATGAWAGASAYAAALGVAGGPLAGLLEVLRGAAWSLFLLAVLGQMRKGRTPTARAGGIFNFGAGAFYIVLLGATGWLIIDAQFAARGAFLTVIVGRIGIAMLNMLLVEQLYRNTSRDARWGIKYACLGIGGMFAFDFYLYSHAMLFRQINVEIWAIRGLIDALTVPLIAVSAARNPRWSPEIAVSRTVIFHSATVLGAAVYLLAMAAAGYYLRLFGGTWGTVMRATFLFCAFIMLFALLFSGSARAWLKVFISKHFYRYRYDYRQEWIRFTRTLSDAGPNLNERTVQAIAALMESPSGALYLSGEEAGSCKAVAHWNMPVTIHIEPLAASLCRYFEATQWVVDLQEFAATPGKYDGFVPPPWLAQNRSAWLVVPLLLGGQLFGIVVLGRPRSAIKLNWEAIDLLKIAGTQAASYLAQRESQNALAVARQFESYTRMSTFIVHDLKNLIAQMSLMLSNAERHKDNPAFQVDMLETIDHAVHKMRMLLQKLARGPAIDSPGHVVLGKVLQQATQGKSTGETKPVLQLESPELAVLADHERLERVIGHLIQNAIEATPRGGSVRVSLCRYGDNALVEVQDTGHGMTEEFIRDKLFRPFESTKAAGMGIGTFESRTYIRLLGGDIDVESVPLVGTTFRVRLPLHQAREMEQIAA
jgi:putative PEP-CTERM system histidine kinase